MSKIAFFPLDYRGRDCKRFHSHACPQHHINVAEDMWGSYDWSDTHDKCGYCGALIRRKPLRQKAIGE